jgi:hypothetical protein
MNLSEELLTKEDYQRALYTVSLEIEESVKKVNFTKKMMRKGFTANIKSFIREDIKSTQCQQAYIISKDAQYESVFELHDEHTEEYNHLLRLREDILKLMSMSQSEMKIV